MTKLMLILLLNSPIAFAALGDRETSIATDQKFFSTISHTTTAHSLYNVHELSDPHIKIREYTANGVVFAVAWSGPIRPDLTQLLGTYHQSYQRNFQIIKGQRSQSLVQGKDLVVQQFGHMRWMQGIAYVPSLLPTGVSSNEIQ